MENVEIFGTIPMEKLLKMSEEDRQDVRKCFESCMSIYQRQSSLEIAEKSLVFAQNEYNTEKYIWENIPPIVYDFVDRWVELVREWNIINNPDITEEKLDLLLKADREKKLRKFSTDIYKYVGKIVDVTGLSIGATGLINGLVIGEKRRAIISTVGAGGYNIQCFHFRTIIKPLKD